MVENGKDEKAKEKVDKIAFITVFKICAIILSGTEIIKT